MSNIKVSVICLVYNHEPYLRKCLDGFVNQKCNFEYEVLINDDASTDNSASIIREYEEKYPDIIKPTYQTENQHSKGVKISTTYLYPKARGEYIAWCEGDDYWTSEDKLQKQVDFLDENLDFSACAHCAAINYVGKNKTEIAPHIEKSREFSAEEIIKGGGAFIPTNSFMMRKEILVKMPSCFIAKGFGDYQLYMYAAFCGKVWCLKDNLSVYNSGIPNSWTNRILGNVEKKEQHYKIEIAMLQRVDEFYEFKYHGAFDYKIRQDEFMILTLHGDKKAMKQKTYKQFYKRYKTYKFRAWLKRKLPFLVKLKRRLKKQN